MEPGEARIRPLRGANNSTVWLRWGSRPAPDGVGTCPRNAQAVPRALRFKSCATGPPASARALV